MEEQGAWLEGEPRQAPFERITKGSFMRMSDPEWSARQEAYAAMREWGYAQAHRTKEAKKKRGLYARDGDRCLRCESAEGLTLDHIIPICRGGETVEENLQVLCSRCNLWKRDRPIAFCSRPGRARSLEEIIRWASERPDRWLQYLALREGASA